MRHDRAGWLGLSLLVALTTLTGCASKAPAGNFQPAPGAARSRSAAEARDVSPDPLEAAKLNVSLGQAYLTKGQLELAMEKLKKAVVLDPKSSDAHTLLAVLYEQINNDKLAEVHYGRAQKLTPEAGASNNNLGRFLCARGRFEEGDRYFLSALADPFYKTPDTALVNRAACAMRWGRSDIAQESLRKALQMSPDNSIALLQMAQLSAEDRDFMRARAFLERHLSGAPAAPDTLLLGLQIETQLGDRRAVDSYRRRLLTEFPESEQAASVAKGVQSP